MRSYQKEFDTFCERAKQCKLQIEANNLFIAGGTFTECIRLSWEIKDDKLYNTAKLMIDCIAGLAHKMQQKKD